MMVNLQNLRHRGTDPCHGGMISTNISAAWREHSLVPAELESPFEENGFSNAMKRIPQISFHDTNLKTGYGCEIIGTSECSRQLT